MGKQYMDMDFDSHEVQTIYPPITPYLYKKLEKKYVDYLWKIIKKGKKQKEEYKHRLAGNVSNSFGIVDEKQYFFNEICVPMIQKFREVNGGEDPVRNFVTLNPNCRLFLHEFWANYQYKHEFNPTHWHGGLYSFVIWMKIPYSWEEQIQLPQFQTTKVNDRKAGMFEFEYSDTRGETRSLSYQLSPDFEGCMCFFPAWMRHAVYPFFGTDEERVSISGNIWYTPGTSAGKGFGSK